MVLSRVFVILCFSLLNLTVGVGQMDSVLVKTFGTAGEDKFKDLIVLDDSVFVVGSTAICNSEDGVILKLDTNLNLVDKVRFGEGNRVESFYSLDSFQDTLYLMGLTNTTGYYQLLSVKMDKQMNVVQSESIDFGGWIICNEVKVNASGVFGVGKVLTTDNEWQGLIFKLDHHLNLDWVYEVGEGLEDEYKDLVFWDDQSLVACGFVTQELTEDRDLLMTKIDFQGNEVWTSEIGEENNDWANSIVRTKDSCLAMVGTTDSYTSVSEDTYFVKTDSNGVFIWSNLHQDQTPDNVLADNGIEVVELSDGSFYVFANVRSFGYIGISDLFTFVTNFQGYWMGSQYMDGPSDDIVMDVFKASDSAVYYCGYTNSYGNGLNEGLIGKIPYVGTSSLTVESEEELYGCYLSVENIETKNLSIYPNPMSVFGEIYIESSLKITEVEVHDVIGNLVDIDTLVGHNVHTISLNGRASGMFLFTIEFEDGSSIVKKVVSE